MNIYNLFEEVIFEEILKNKSLLTEGVSIDQVKDAIINKYHVHILYDDYPDAVPSKPPSKRYIEIYTLGDTKAGNKAIRAWQMGGFSKRNKGNFKIFRLDRIRQWTPTKVKWNKAISDLYPGTVPNVNKTGDAVFSKIDMVAQYRVDTPVKPKASTKPKALTKSKEDTKLQKLQQKSLEKQKTKKSSYQAKGNPKPEPIDTSKTTIGKTSKTTAPKTVTKKNK